MEDKLFLNAVFIYGKFGCIGNVNFEPNIHF